MAEALSKCVSTLKKSARLGSTSRSSSAAPGWTDALSGDRYSLFSADRAGRAQRPPRKDRRRRPRPRASLAPKPDHASAGAVSRASTARPPVSFTLSLVPEEARGRPPSGRQRRRRRGGRAPRELRRPREADEGDVQGSDHRPGAHGARANLAGPPDGVPVREGCKGSVPSCGQDLNERSCGCAAKAWTPLGEAAF